MSSESPRQLIKIEFRLDFLSGLSFTSRCGEKAEKEDFKRLESKSEPSSASVLRCQFHFLFRRKSEALLKRFVWLIRQSTVNFRSRYEAAIYIWRKQRFSRCQLAITFGYFDLAAMIHSQLVQVQLFFFLSLSSTTQTLFIGSMLDSLVSILDIGWICKEVYIVVRCTFDCTKARRQRKIK